MELDIMNANNSALEREEQIFRELTLELLEFRFDMLSSLSHLSSPAIKQFSAILSILDVSCGLGKQAIDFQLVRPNLTEGLDWNITSGRHFVVERNISNTDFVTVRHLFYSPLQVPNDCVLPGIWLVTGSNMGGKV